MKITTKTGVIMVIALAAIFLIAAILFRTPSQTLSKQVAKVTYVCNTDKMITASYFDGPRVAVKAGEAPIPAGSVVLLLSDGRTLTLKQTISADGSRYANADESMVFWSKGRGLLFTESGISTYDGCLQVADNPGGLDLVYENAAKGFSLRYPVSFTPDTTYSYQAQGPGRAIGGVKFTIPATVATGTNLGADSYISIEQLANPSECSASIFLRTGIKTTVTTEDNTTYSVASSTDAAAGNRYEETVYALPGTSPCMAVRYFIHYGVIENYTPGAVKVFDKSALLSQFNAIRQALIIGQ